MSEEQKAKLIAMIRELEGENRKMALQIGRNRDAIRKYIGRIHGVAAGDVIEARGERFMVREIFLSDHLRPTGMPPWLRVSPFKKDGTPARLSKTIYSGDWRVVEKASVSA